MPAISPVRGLRNAMNHVSRSRFALVVVTTAFAVVGLAVACGGESLSDDSGGPASTADGGESAQAETLFRQLEPALSDSCGGAAGVCHVQGVGGAPAWLRDPDRYVSIKAYDNAQSGSRKFITDKVEDSRLFTKGRHSGPEIDIRSPLGQVVSTYPGRDRGRDLVEGPQGHHRPDQPRGRHLGDDHLARLASGMKGASLTFDVELLGSLLTLSKMTAHAPATNGIRVTHPLFIQVVGKTGTPDPGDSCANVDTKVKETGSAPLGPGTLVLPSWTADAKLAISFDYVGPYEVVDGPNLDGGFEAAASGCKNLNGYTAIVDNFTGGAGLNCTNCHAGGNAQNALDMNELAQPSPDYGKACASALFQVSLGNEAHSPNLLAPPSA